MALHRDGCLTQKIRLGQSQFSIAATIERDGQQDDSEYDMVMPYREKRVPPPQSVVDCEWDMSNHVN